MKKEPRFRMVCWCKAARGSGLVEVEDISRWHTLEDVEKWAQGVLDAGNSEYIELLDGNRKVKTLCPKGTRH